MTKLSLENQAVSWYHNSKENESSTNTLKERITVDVAVIGAGVMGLSIARSLAQENTSVAVIEAGMIGDGASGRNGGLIVPIMKAMPSEILHAFGDKGEQLLNCVTGSANSVYDLIERYHIQCDLVRGGFFLPVHARSLQKSVNLIATEWKNYGATTEFLGFSDTQKHLGTTNYYSSLYEPAGGCVNPIAYVRGLGRAALQEGAKVFTNSPVFSAQKISNGWKLNTEEGSITAGQVVQCTGTQLPGFDFEQAQAASQSQIPIQLYALATSPLTESARRIILPQGQSATDTRNYVLSVGYDVEGRLVTSGFAPLGNGSIGLAHMKHFVSRRLRKVYPEIGEFSFDYVWSGRASINADWLPRIISDDENWHAVTTCNGRGLALSTAIGQSMGESLLRGNLQDLPLPITTAKRIKNGSAYGTFMSRAMIPAGSLQDWWRRIT